MDLEMAKVNLHFFDFVGLVERFDLSLQLFCKIYQIRPSGKAHVVNVTRSESYLKREISQDVADLIAERSCYDIELYEYASGLFREKLRVLGLLESMTDLSHSRRIL